MNERIRITYVDLPDIPEDLCTHCIFDLCTYSIFVVVVDVVRVCCMLRAVFCAG